MSEVQWSIMRPDLMTEEHPPILAVDPGKVSGVAFLGVRDRDHHGWLAEIPFLPALDRCHEVIEQHETLQVVCESFHVTPRTARNTAAPWSLESIGALRWMAHRAGPGVTFHLQSPALAKRGASRDRLKAAGWYVATKDGHAADAARHLYVRLVQQRLLVPPITV